MGKEVIMELFSQRYGWTPDEIRAMAVEDVDVYLQIIQTEGAIRKSRELKNKK